MRPLLKFTAITIGIVVTLAIGWVLVPNSLYYQQGRPTPLGLRVNRFMARLFATGIMPGWMPTLEVRRRSGRGMQRQPVVVAVYVGERYLVSMLGPESQWVKNVAAANGAATLIHRKKEHVRLVEVPVPDRAPILQAYLQRAWGARPHFPIPHTAPVEAFAAIAADYPVFRIAPTVSTHAHDVTPDP
jgi:hypothetical protein